MRTCSVSLQRSTQAWLAALAALALAGPAESSGIDWGVSGRPLPAREAVQPELDPGLKPYRSCRQRDGGRIVGTAPAILPDLVNRWISAFQRFDPAIRVDVPPRYDAPQGALNPRFHSFLTGSGDFAFLTRAISPADRATFESSRQHAPLIVPVAGGSYRHFGFVDPVVIVVNEANPVRRISNDDLRKLLAAGVPDPERPKSWADVGAESWPDRPINIVGGADWRGEATARGLVVRERLLEGDNLRSDLGQASGREADVPDRVASDTLAIGFTGLGQMREGVRALPIQDREGHYVWPGREEVTHARYPLARTVDLVLATPVGGPIKPELAEFLRFILSRDGQSVVREQGVFLPLRAFQADAALASVGLSPFSCPGSDSD